MIESVRNLSSANLTSQWQEDLRKSEHTTEFLASLISQGTPDKVKQLLSSDKPPTPTEIRDLGQISTDQIQPGSYLGATRIEGVEDEDECFIYQGSATRVGRVLADRVYKQHLNTEYREKELL